jgi:hypothetical protein
VQVKKMDIQTKEKQLEDAKQSTGRLTECCRKRRTEQKQFIQVLTTIDCQCVGEEAQSVS